MSEQQHIPPTGGDTVIIGAGPAGLTAAFELVRQQRRPPVILEMTSDIGGLAKTVAYKGNRIDFGGHRFFSKSDRVMDWWTRLLPVDHSSATGRSNSRIPEPGEAKNAKLPSSRATTPAMAPEANGEVMLIRQRVSRILYLRRLFDYPITLNRQTLGNLGWQRTVRIALSYAAARWSPIRPEQSLADLITNQFGSELYRTFFQDYTEKVWGIPGHEIPPEWGSQRIQGLSLRKVCWHAARNLLLPKRDLGRRNTEISLIEQFYYPKYGPGQLWEKVARTVVQGGGQLHFNQQVTGLVQAGSRIVAVESRDAQTGNIRRWPCDQVFSSMPVQDLISAVSPAAPEPVRKVAEGLRYRDFITVGLLLRRLTLKHPHRCSTTSDLIPDQWIYVQEPDVKAGRIQIFNNWSPYLVADPSHVWIGIEYFCTEGDAFWRQSNTSLGAQAVEEMVKIGVVDRKDVLDQVVLRMPKAYPAYFGAYAQFETIRAWTDTIPNLFLIGRNGMHRYNNMDHSMLTAMAAVDCARENTGKQRIWAVNGGQDNHEIR